LISDLVILKSAFPSVHIAKGADEDHSFACRWYSPPWIDIKLPLPAPESVVEHAPVLPLETLTLALPLAEPPLPVHVIVYEVVAVGLTCWLPLVTLLLVHEAVHEEARTLDQLMVEACPDVIAEGLAVTLTDGACGGVGVGVGDGAGFAITPNRTTVPVLEDVSEILLAAPDSAPVPACTAANGVAASVIKRRRMPKKLIAATPSVAPTAGNIFAARRAKTLKVIRLLITDVPCHKHYRD
jgi:hypothetical protein